MGHCPIQETHAATTGPAHAHLPASSTPKIVSRILIFLEDKDGVFIVLY